VEESTAPTTPGGQVVNTEERRRTAFVELELAAVWQGHERGVVTIEEVHQRLEELERLLWRRVLGHLRKLTPEASVYVGFAVEEQPAQELA
jgi:hypothetical protein